jgi:hypothetical protein
MLDPAGEANNGPLRLDFDRRVMLRFHGSAILRRGNQGERLPILIAALQIPSDGGLLAYCELDDVPDGLIP